MTTTPAEPARDPAPAPLPLRVARAPVRVLARGSRAAWDWTRRPIGRFVVPSLLVLALVGAAGAAGGAVLPGLYQRPDPTVAASPGAAVPTGSNESVDIPTSAPVDPIEGPQPESESESESGEVTGVLHTWAVEMAGRTGIPVVAVQAYGYAELVLAQTTPGCQLRWTTLAAIGRVESNHGSSGGSKLLRTGQALPPIYGDPLDGTGNRLLITDTDQGELDDDTRYDRAVGPMQFIPATWRLEAVDGSGDGLADVHNVYDAALAAGSYLCRDGRDLSNVDDWWQAILSYNNVTSYANAVYAAANEYGELSR